MPKPKSKRPGSSRGRGRGRSVTTTRSASRASRALDGEPNLTVDTVQTSDDSPPLSSLSLHQLLECVRTEVHEEFQAHHQRALSQPPLPPSTQVPGIHSLPATLGSLPPATSIASVPLYLNQHTLLLSTMPPSQQPLISWAEIYTRASGAQNKNSVISKLASEANRFSMVDQVQTRAAEEIRGTQQERHYSP